MDLLCDHAKWPIEQEATVIKESGGVGSPTPEPPKVSSICLFVVGTPVVL